MGISENAGHAITLSILNETTNKVISRSNDRPEGKSTSPNFRIDPLTTTEAITSRHLPSVHVEDNEEAPASTEG